MASTLVRRKFVVIEDPAPNPEKMRSIVIEAVEEMEVALAIRYLDPDLEGFEEILTEIPAGEALSAAIRYLDPDFN